MARNYKKMDIYHLAYSFVHDVYKVTKDFPKEEDQNITSQIRRASVSLPLNIAEGSAKASAREFAYFLNVAYASGKEVEVLVRLSYDLGYMSEDAFTYLSHRLDEVNAKLFLFLRNIESRVGGKYQFFKKFEERKDVVATSN